MFLRLYMPELTVSNGDWFEVFGRVISYQISQCCARMLKPGQSHMD